MNNYINFCEKNNIKYVFENEELWICLSKFSKLLNINNPISSVSRYPKTYLKKIKTKTNGGIQLLNYLNIDGLKRLISTSHSDKKIEICKELEFNIYDNAIVKIETETINFIKKCFSNEEMVTQYSVLNYRIDLYFPKYKLAIECDEKEHKNQIEKDIKRENEIKSILNCTFIRYEPEEKNFCISYVINSIYKHIIQYNNNLQKEKEKKIKFIIVNKSDI
jgi:very-short-patch-repair endonuclease